MSDAGAFQPLSREPGEGRYQVSMVPFSVLLADLSLPAAGAAAVTADTFLLIPGDHVIDRAFLQLEGTVSNEGVGTTTISLVQALGDGFVEGITSETSLDGSDTDVIEMPLQRERLETARSLYLRVVGSTSTGGGTPWYATSGLRLNGTVHFHLD